MCVEVRAARRSCFSSPAVAGSLGWSSGCRLACQCLPTETPHRPLGVDVPAGTSAAPCLPSMPCTNLMCLLLSPGPRHLSQPKSVCRKLSRPQRRFLVRKCSGASRGVLPGHHGHREQGETSLLWTRTIHSLRLSAVQALPKTQLTPWSCL